MTFRYNAKRRFQIRKCNSVIWLVVDTLLNQIVYSTDNLEDAKTVRYNMNNL